MTVIGAVLELWELQDKDVLQHVVWSFMSIYDKVKDAVVAAKQLSIGNPLDENNHVGPHRYRRSRNVLR
jgi:hypothetical protein